MIMLIIILIMIAVVLAISLAISLKDGSTYEDDSNYLDKNGDHLYYDKSIIEKKLFYKLHPKEAARTFTRLFRRK